MASDENRAQNPLVAKLLQFTPLSDEDIRVLEALCSSEKRLFRPSRTQPGGLDQPSNAEERCVDALLRP